ncbi:MAG TPA: MoxR family ATPase [Candidatus Wallbacteria bacterium]|nr:MoxR family ATPase [Candidatus Wallbacteria bacterium]
MSEKSAFGVQTGGAAEGLKLEIASFAENFQKVKNEISKRIAGYSQVIDMALFTLFSGGHVLLEGVPGIGKTQMVKTIAEVFALKFKRVQFTPDLMPSDVLGSHVLVEDEKGGRHLKFNEGPVFCNILLADEINRATPKTQSALLECMAEGTVSISNTKFTLGQPFFVLATENPLEMEGTFALPEAQLDRFMMKINLSYPTFEQLDSIVERYAAASEPKVECVIDPATVIKMQGLVRQVLIADDVKNYAINIIKKTHPDYQDAPAGVKKYVKFGSSPRGLLSLILTAKARAIIKGRVNVSFEDLRAVAENVLNHRIILNFEGLADGISPSSIVAQAVN